MNGSNHSFFLTLLEVFRPLPFVQLFRQFDYRLTYPVGTLPLAPHSRRGSQPKDARSEVACLATPFFSIRGGLFQELLRQRRT